MTLTFMTNAEFAETREALGLSHHALAWLLGMSEKATRKQEANGSRDPHPTAVRILEWMRDGELTRDWMRAALDDRPEDWNGSSSTPKWSGPMFRSYVEDIGLSDEQAALIFNVEVGDFQKWCRNAPHPCAVRAVQLMREGFRPREFPTALGVEARL